MLLNEKSYSVSIYIISFLLAKEREVLIYAIIKMYNIHQSVAIGSFMGCVVRRKEHSFFMHFSIV